MEDVLGNTLIFTDQHFGIKSNSPLRQKIGVLVIKKMLDFASKNQIDNIVFCGDYFHQRNALTIDTLNIAHKCIQALAKHAKLYMILGNHDLFNKNSTDVNSINIFRENKNVVVVDKAVEVNLNGCRSLFVPWLANLSNMKKDSYDFMFGHFDISTKFLIDSYAKVHSATVEATSKVSNEIDSSFENNSSNSTIELPGNFIDLVKVGGTIFAGHIHQHQEMKIKNRNFIFVGSPYEQNLGDIGCKCGFYVVDRSNNYAFHEISGIPKHVKFKSSDVQKIGIDKYDFSSAANNIVQKVYDTDVSLEDDMQISQKIESFKPYEELLPDYQVELNFDSENAANDQNYLVKSLKKSKLEYIEKYVEQIDSKALDANNIERLKLLKIMEKYYKLASGESI